MMKGIRVMKNPVEEESEAVDSENDQSEEDEENNEDDEDSGSSDDREDNATKSVAGQKRGLAGDAQMPLWKRLDILSNQELKIASTVIKPSTTSSTKKFTRDIQDQKSHSMADSKKTDRIDGRTNKNAPAVMKSNKPVRRLRIDADNTTRKSRDPRFAEGSGDLSHDKFLQAYSFLDKYQEDEIDSISQSMKKINNPEDKEVLKTELFKRRQEMTERRRSLKLKERLSVARADEREKVKNGKLPFHLNRNAKKVLALEERFDELKGEGKLSSFLLKKRKKNANKDHRWLPSRREDSS